jgi:Protein of unknown function (DUF1573)/HYDIN/CFA65/VesB-like, Ig-like domain
MRSKNPEQRRIHREDPRERSGEATYGGRFIGKAGIHRNCGSGIVEAIYRKEKMRNLFRYFCVSLLLAACVTATTNAQLKIVEGPEVSFGKIYQTGEMVHKVITVRNAGPDSITINKVTTSCGCTAALVSNTVLAPGQETEVKIQFNPTGYIGEVTKYVYIANSDPKDQLVTVRMTGYVAYALQPTPGYVLFNNAHVGRLDSAEVTLSNTTAEEMQITGVEVPTKEISYKLSRKVLKPGEFADLSLYIDPADGRDVDGYIVIRTTSDKQPQLQIRVFAGLIGR